MNEQEYQEYQKFSISMRSDIVEAVSKRRGKRSTTINKLLRWHLYAMEQSLEYWRERLCAKELYLIVDALKDVELSDPRWINTLPSYVNSVIEERGLNIVWDIEHGQLIEHLERSSIIEKFALVDAVNRWFLLSEDNIATGIHRLLAPQSVEYKLEEV